MSVVIIGGNERMEEQYKKICQNHKCEVKIFTKAHGRFQKQIGHPELIILFTDTVAHKMLATAHKEAKKNGISIRYVNSSSSSALKNVLESY
jgi:hypothetical protein